MFKIFWGRRPAQRAGSGSGVDLNHRFWSDIGFRFSVPVLLSAVLCSGCMTVSHPLSSVNLKEPGWTVRQGQAVWHLAKAQGGREFAGEVLVATRPDGRAFVQFSKSPFPLVIGQENPRQWQIEFPPQNKHYAGRGKPPKRIIWLYLPEVLAGKSPPEDWTWHEDSSGWKLEDHRNGESIEGFFESSAALKRLDWPAFVRFSSSPSPKPVPVLE